MVRSRAGGSPGGWDGDDGAHGLGLVEARGQRGSFGALPLSHSLGAGSSRRLSVQLLVAEVLLGPARTRQGQARGLVFAWRTGERKPAGICECLRLPAVPGLRGRDLAWEPLLWLKEAKIGCTAAARSEWEGREAMLLVPVVLHSVRELGGF